MSATAEISPALSQVLTLVDSLTPDDRTRLRTILDESSTGMTPEVREAWKSEIHRRLAEIEEGKVIGIPAEVVHQRIQARLAAMRANHEAD
jgi:putative addiction module component (TIGR02574 family)